MPEAKLPLLYSYSPEPPKKPPIIKVSCGIGDTDGYPAFDSESDIYDSRDDSKWGFLITGGAEFHMPLTVFQVSPDGLADKGGIRLGDIILEVNEEDATQLTLAQAHERIAVAGKRIQLLVKSMEDDEHQPGYEPVEEKSIVLRVPKAPPPPKASIEDRLREMQRKLSEIAEIPKILSSTLATVSQTFEKLVPSDAREMRLLARRGAQRRKLSYDEDALDYELSNSFKDASVDDDDFENGEDNDDGEEAFTANGTTCAASKEVTPESDYVSEANYFVNGDDDDGGDSDYDCEYEDIDCDDQGADVGEDLDDSGDFQSTTGLSWNLQNVPGLTLNDGGFDAELRSDDVTDAVVKEEGVQKRGELAYELTSAPPQSQAATQEISRSVKQEKLEKLERSWPWADRERIIYKQSTCHLVPRKPFGIIEQRIQLLAKQNLVAKLSQVDQP